MQNNSENLKKLIILKFGSLKKCAELLEITPSTLSRNLSNPSDKFVNKLRKLGVPIPEDNGVTMINSLSAIISEDGVEGFIIKEKNNEYEKDMHARCREQIIKCLEEIKQLKIENYDLRKQLEQLTIKN